MFIHIPKCAGTTVRAVLGHFDDTRGRYESSVRDHPEFGSLDYTHLPLEVLRRICPEDFEKILRYQTFALVRDPQERFVSALSQRFKMYSSRELAQRDKSEVDRLALEIVELLKEPGATYHPELIHFARQSEFIFCGGEQLVDTILPTSRIGDMVQQLSRLTGEKLSQVGNDNPTMVFRFDAFRRLAMGGKWLGERALNPKLTGAARRLARQILMTPLQNNRDIYVLSNDVTDFVRRFYAPDFELFAKSLEVSDVSPLEE